MDGEPQSVELLRTRLVELEQEIEAVRQREETLTERCRLLRGENSELIRRSLDLSDMKRDLEDKYFELETVRRELKAQNVNLIRKSIELSDVMRQLEDKNYDLQHLLKQLDHSRERFRSLTESTSDWVWEVDALGRYTYASPKVRDLLGYEPEELIGATPFDLMLKADAQLSAQQFAEFAEQRQPIVRLINVNRHKDGHEVMLETSGVPIVGDDGELVGYRGIDRDVTSSRQTEEMVHRQRHALEQSIDGIVICDMDLTFRFVNSAWARMHEFDVEELVDHSMSTCHTEEQMAEEVRPFLSELVKTGGQNAEIGHQRRDGTQFPTRMSASVLHNEQDEPIGIVAIAHDSTQEQRLETQLRQAQKMEAIGQLAGGIAHDFNNLLSPILGYVELLMLDYQPDDPSFEELEQIQQAALRGRELTRQILAFSRRQVLEMQTVSLCQVVRDFEKAMRRTIREDIELHISCDADGGYINADVSQIEQILMNLAVNAQDAMPRGGELRIETSALQVRAMDKDVHPGVEPGSYAVLTVSDTGSGMEPSVLKHACEPFFTTKEKGKGTGLGLATVYGIVNQHNGYLVIESEPGQGTTFVISFPRVHSPEQEDARQPSRPVRSSEGEEVLVVEDDQMVRNIVCRILRKNGYKVVDASDAVSCLAAVKDRAASFRLLVTDVVMPQMNGKELYQELLVNNPELKVLFMSGYTTEVIAARGITDDPARFIQKPISVEELLAKVEQALHGDQNGQE